MTVQHYTNRLTGVWVSDERDTAWGPMWFEFRIGTTGRFEVIGTPSKGVSPAEYRREGPYLINGEFLTSPAINEGQPVLVRLKGAELILTVSPTLAFRLRRQ